MVKVVSKEDYRRLVRTGEIRSSTRHEYRIRPESTGDSRERETCDKTSKSRTY